MSVSEFLTSMISVAPSAVLDYAVIGLALKLPLRLKLGWGARLFPLAMFLMAVVHAWQRPVELSGAICLGVVILARLLQAATAWGQSLRAHLAPFRSAAARNALT